MATETPSFESLSPNLIVSDVNRSVEFYVSLLGFTLLATVPDSGTFNWAMVQRGPVTVMFQTLASMQDDAPSFESHCWRSRGNALYQSLWIG